MTVLTKVLLSIAVVVSLPLVLIFGIGLMHAVGTELGPLGRRNPDRPAMSALAGVYVSRDKRYGESRISLNPDGTIQVANLPHFAFGSGEDKSDCRWNGTGHAELADDVRFYVDDVKSATDCPAGEANENFFILNKRKPYELYACIQDCDAFEGLLLKQE
jgi:hypothetical protein